MRDLKVSRNLSVSVGMVFDLSKDRFSINEVSEVSLVSIVHRGLNNREQDLHWWKTLGVDGAEVRQLPVGARGFCLGALRALRLLSKGFRFVTRELGIEVHSEGDHETHPVHGEIPIGKRVVHGSSPRKIRMRIRSGEALAKD